MNRVTAQGTLRPATGLERLEDHVSIAALACSVTALVWLAARWAGWHPPSPLIVWARAAGFATICLLAAAEALRFLARSHAREADGLDPAPLRWTRLSLGLAGAGVVLTRAASLVDGHRDAAVAVGHAIGPITAALGLAALVDAADGRRRRSLSTVGIAGTAIGGVGAILVAVSIFGGRAVPDAVGRWLIVVAFLCLASAGACYLTVRRQGANPRDRVPGA